MLTRRQLQGDQQAEEPGERLNMLCARVRASSFIAPEKLVLSDGIMAWHGPCGYVRYALRTPTTWRDASKSIHSVRSGHRVPCCRSLQKSS